MTPPASSRSPAARTVDRTLALVEWWKDSRPGRSFYRYLYARGALLSGGIAYSALFSLFAALTIGYTVFMQVLGGREELADAVFEQINELVPGLIAIDGKHGVISPDDLLLDPGLSLTSVVAAGVLLFSAVTFMYHLRGAIRTMFGVSDVGQSPVLARLRGLVGFILLAVSILVSTVSGIVVTTLGTQVLDALGITGSGAVVVGVTGLVVSALLDAVVFAVVVVFLGGVDVRRRDLVAGALTAGVAFGALRYLGSTVIATGASHNALLASFAVIATLLVLVNVVARILLLICAWMADPPREREPEPGGPRHSRGGRPELPVVDGTRAADGRHLAPPTTDERLRTGQGHGKPWSPLVRGIRRGRLPRTL